jgi:hypothetical protein
VVCVLLVGFLLYNPFISLIHSPSGITIHHLTRNRSTVGAGELQNFSPQSKAAAVNVLTVERIGGLLVTPAQVEFPVATDIVPVRSIFQDFSSNLFFRPPPSL